MDFEFKLVLIEENGKKQNVDAGVEIDKDKMATKLVADDEKVDNQDDKIAEDKEDSDFHPESDDDDETDSGQSVCGDDEIILNKSDNLTEENEVNASPKLKSQKNKSPGKKPRQKRTPNNTDKKYGCVFCDQIFSNPILRIEHENKSHTELIPTCVKCHKGFHRRTMLKILDKKTKLPQYHIKCSPKQTFACRGCDAKFTFEKRLRDHVKRVHNSHQTIHCSFPGCKKTFYTKFYFEQHVKFFHPENPEEKAVCEVCKESFKCVAEKIRHLKKKHVKQENYECKECKKSFKSEQLLKIHQRVHTKEVAYLCTNCGRSFKQMTPFPYHTKIVCNPDKKEAEVWRKKRADRQREDREKMRRRGINCDDCGKKFARRENYAEHVKKIHGDGDEANSMEIEEDD